MDWIAVDWGTSSARAYRLGPDGAVLAVSALTVQGEAWRLAALAPIESELETETLVAWRQLVQVLTHEIMNSLTPIIDSYFKPRVYGRDRRGIVKQEGIERAGAANGERGIAASR